MKQWWFIPFERLAQYASWNLLGDGRNMMGGSSIVGRIPKDRFSPLNSAELAKL